MLTKQHIWDNYDDIDRQNIIAWIRTSSNRQFYGNNWQWFRLFHLIFLEWSGESVPEDAFVTCFSAIDDLYAGEGWYTDGNLSDERTFDYYNAWTMHFLGLMFCGLGSSRFKEKKNLIAKRAAQFLPQYRLLFQRNGGHVAYGRSQIYRFASLAPFGPAIAEGIDRDICDTKAICIDTINAYSSQPMLDSGGFIRAGVFGQFLHMTEAYSGAGSAYWATLGFSCLLLDANDAFWLMRSRRALAERSTDVLSQPGVVICRQGSGEVLMLNGGVSSNLYGYKYNKLAYSSSVWFDYDEEFPVDNQLLLASGTSAWSAQRLIEKFEVCDAGCSMVWRPLLRRDVVMVETSLEPVQDGYLAKHHLRTDKELRFAAGGFPVEYRRGATRCVASGNAQVAHEGGTSAIELITGSASSRIVRRKGVNPRWGEVEVPILVGRLAAGSAELVYRVTVR
jgi:Uncharacterized protein conserved in bacteria (DUF2264)